jgi:hypothetical protein
VPTIPDHWHASAITTAADLAPFTEDDLQEARSRLTRLAQIWEVRLRALTPAELDRRDGDAWSPRQIAVHLEGSRYYADALGHLTAVVAGEEGEGVGRRGGEALGAKAGGQDIV